MLEELGFAYQHVPLDMRNKEHKSEKYLQINPNGKVPAIIDGEYIIWESMAITSYLAKKHGSPLAPQNVEEEGHAMQWSFWALVDFQPHAVNWLVQEKFVPAEVKNEKVIEDAKAAMPRVLGVLEKGLQNKKYLLGSRFTVADVNVATCVNLLQNLGYDTSSYSNVTQWMNACMERPAFQKLQNLRGG